MCSENCVTACEGREWNAPGCVQTLDLCVCVCACVWQGKQSPRRGCQSPLGPPLLHTSPRPHPGPFLAATLFANTLSSSPWPPWLPAQRKATTQAGSCVTLSLAPAPRPRLLLRPPRCCLVGSRGGGRTPKDPFHLNSIQRPGDMGSCSGQSRWASWSRGLLERIRWWVHWVGGQQEQDFLSPHL